MACNFDTEKVNKIMTEFEACPEKGTKVPKGVLENVHEVLKGKKKLFFFVG